MIESTPPKLTKEERLAALEAAKVARVKRFEGLAAQSRRS